MLMKAMGFISGVCRQEEFYDVEVVKIVPPCWFQISYKDLKTGTVGFTEYTNLEHFLNNWRRAR